MSKKRFTKEAIKKLKSLVARGNHSGRMTNNYVIDEIFPPSILCEYVTVLLRKDARKREIPLQVGRRIEK